MNRDNVNPKKKYVVSTLRGSSKGQQPLTDAKLLSPKVELRPRAEDIFIPSVSMTVDADSPRSLGSHDTQNFYGTDDHLAMSPLGQRGAGGRGPKSLNHPLVTGANGNLTFEVSAGNSPPDEFKGPPSLDRLDRMLPKAMRGLRSKVANETMRELRHMLAVDSMIPFGELAQSGRASPMNDEDVDDGSSIGEYTVESGMDYPTHKSSGASIQLFPKKQEARGKLWGSGRSAYDGLGLWGEDFNGEVRPGSTLEAREAALAMEKSRKTIDAITSQMRLENQEHEESSSSAYFINAAGERVENQIPAGIDSDDEHSLEGHDVLGAYLNIGGGEQAAVSSKEGTRPSTGGAETADLNADEEGNDEQKQTSEDIAKGIQPVDTSALMSKTRKNLQDLGKYVYGHTNRKIMVAWTPIESRFLKSPIRKVEMTRDASGLMCPVKRPALYLSALTGILCSSGIRCTWQELAALYDKFGCKPADVLRSRQLASIKVVLGPSNGQGLRQKDELLEDMRLLLSDGDEPMVSLDQLLAAVFPADPKERQKELDSLEGEKAAYIQQMVDEKNKREAMALAVQTRKAKMLSDFDDSVREIQFAKGPLMFNKHKALKELIAYCATSYEKAHAETDVKVSDELVALLGVECFPKCVKRGIQETQQRMREEHAKYAHKPGQKLPEFKKGSTKRNINPSTAATPGTSSEEKRESDSSASASKTPVAIAPPSRESVEAELKEKEKERKADNKPKRIGYTGGYRVLLHRPVPGVPLPLVPLIREVVGYGKGLIGMAYRDVVEMLQAYSSTRLQSRFRCHKRWWRFKIARNRWSAIFRSIKARFFLSWAKFIRHVYDTRNFCWRKIKAWQTYTKNAKKRREHFRINFWPFYVWHRYAAASRTATEKARFLVHRVEPTLRTLRVFKAWSKYYYEEKRMRVTADEFSGMVLKYRARIALAWYRRWTRRRIRIRKNWYKHGMITYKHKIFLCKLTPFLIWKTIWYYRRLLHQRIVKFSPIFRTHFLWLQPARKVPLLGEIKARAKAAYEASGGDEKRKADAKKAKKKAKVKASGGADDQSDAGSSIAGGGNSVASKKLSKPHFYKPGPRYCGNGIDSDGEEEEFTPTRMRDIYRDQIQEIISPSELDFLGEADDFIFEKILVLSRRFTVVDNWNMCEWSVRYHFLMHRALKILRTYAKVARSTRKSRIARSKKTKNTCFLALLAWMMRDPASMKDSDQTEAERLYVEAKSYRMEKMMKWRGVAHEIKTQLDRDGLDDDDDAVYVDGAISKAVVWARKQKRQEAMAKRQADIDAGIPVFSPPNFLDWDRNDRETEYKQSELMLKVSKEVRLKAFTLSERADRETDTFEKQLVLQDNAVVAIFHAEETDSAKAIDNEMEYIDKFKIHAAGELVNVIYKLYKEVQLFLLKAETKRYFRALRMPMIIQRSHSMYNRKRIVNWIRICRRLSSLSKNANFYYQRRKAWVVFNRWLKLVERESLDVSPGLVSYIRRKSELFPKFSNRLKAHGFVRTVYTNSRRLLKASSDVGSIFYRWLMTITGDKVFQKMEATATRHYELKLLQKVFWSLRTLMTPAETHEFRIANVPFAIVRARCDLDQFAKRFLAPRRLNVQICIRSYNRRYVYYSMRDARRTQTFKSFMIFYKRFVERRIIREQRILCESFENRGVQDYRDICCPDLQDPIMPGMMARLDGKKFTDPHPLTQDQFSSLTPVLPGGFRIGKIRINHQAINGNEDASITGWQVVWVADGVADVEGPKRGKWKGAAMTVHEFTVPKDDFVMGVEYLYDGPSMLGCRVKCFFSGFSRWLGARPSLGILSVYLGCDLAPRQEFENDYVLPGRDEEENPAMPRSFVIGFTGVDFKGKCSAMGLIVRKVKDQHIFSYTWVGDALLKRKSGAAGGPTTARVIGADKAGQNLKEGADAGDGVELDLKSLPSNVDTGRFAFNKGAGNVSISESLTVSVDKLPPVPGAKSDNPESLDDASSLDHSVTFADSNVGNTQSLEEGGDAEADEIPEQVSALLSSEEQFFDVLRMRNMEIVTAQSRAENFARRLWTARLLRKDPVLSKLTTVGIIAPLTKWYFQGICKRLVNATATEAAGEAMLEGARIKRLNTDKLTRRSVSQGLARDECIDNKKHQPWFNLKLMTPQNRADKMNYLERIELLTKEAVDLRQQARTLLEEAVEDEKKGKMLLPRVQLSTFVCGNFGLKLSAARHKETLLERMDLDAIKKALSGADAKVSELSDVSMEMIRSSLAGKKGNSGSAFTLEKLIEAEMLKSQKKQTLALSVPSSARGGAERVSNSRRDGAGNAASGPRDDGPMYMKSFAQYKEAMGTPSYRKNNVINSLHSLSKTSATLSTPAGTCIGERTLMSSSSAAFLSANKNAQVGGVEMGTKQNMIHKLMSKSLDVPKGSVNSSKGSTASAAELLADKILAL